MTKRIEAFVANDGTIHLTEGAAIRADILELLERTAKQGDVPPDQVKLVSAHGLAVIEQALSSLLPLLNRLDDPRNRAPRAASAPIQRAPAPDGMEVVTTFPAPGDKELVFVDSAFPAVDPSELRVGQLVECVDRELIVKSIDLENNLVVLNFEDTELGATSDEIIRVIKQPEEMMALDEAELALSDLPSDPDMGTSEGRLAHTRRVLLLRRINELENDNAPE